MNRKREHIFLHQLEGKKQIYFHTNFLDHFFVFYGLAEASAKGVDYFGFVAILFSEAEDEAQNCIKDVG